MELLQEVEGSVLWLLELDPEAKHASCVCRRQGRREGEGHIRPMGDGSRNTLLACLMPISALIAFLTDLTRPQVTRFGVAFRLSRSPATPLPRGCHRASLQLQDCVISLRPRLTSIGS